MTLLARDDINGVYIAGPMTGYPDHNRDAFVDAKTAISKLLPNASVWTPFDKSIQATRQANVTLDMLVLCGADLIVMLPGWTQSRGAVAEFIFAASADISLGFYNSLNNSIVRID